MNSRLSMSFLVVAFASSLLLPRHAFAAFTPGACKEDEQKFCGSVQPGGGNIRDCMKQHEADLSQACKDNIAEGKKKMEQKMAEIKEACGQDIQKYCANVTPGQGREIACLKSYDDKISAACKEKLPKRMMRKRMGQHKDGGKPEDKDDQPDGDSDQTPPPPPAGK
jgi:hypothetical protein